MASKRRPSSTDTSQAASSAEPTWRVMHADARDAVAELRDGSVDCVVTSPPYWRQRDYGYDGQLGNEADPNAYVARLVELFAEIRRVLNTTGTVWLNLGDKYHNGRLMGMPWRVALALQDEGWWLRADVIWHKPNAMPSSVKNRPTVDHEYLFLLTRGEQYYYDADAIREPHVTFSEASRMKGGRKHFGVRGGTPEIGKNSGNVNMHDARWDQAFHPAGRNRRTVWSIPLSKNRDAHFAVFPQRLVEICLRAGCPAGGTVLDPFMGTGTTGRVALGMGLGFIGIDRSEEYCDIARRHLQAASDAAKS
ncbi:MAG: site-specific DNA-methyltransferase [Planctomycetales bacterium]|nr:site-specific DNA-methyltransferase [Planctomycetales bacterium]